MKNNGANSANGSDDPNKVRVPPTASIQSVDQLGKVKIKFSKRMVVVPEIQTLNQNGILVEPHNQNKRRLNQTEGEAAAPATTTP